MGDVGLGVGLEEMIVTVALIPQYKPLPSVDSSNVIPEDEVTATVEGNEDPL